MRLDTDFGPLVCRGIVVSRMSKELGACGGGTGMDFCWKVRKATDNFEITKKAQETAVVVSINFGTSACALLC